MVRATVSVSAEPSSTKPHFEVRPPPPFGTATAATRQPRLRNLSVPTGRQSKAVCSTPEGWRRLEGDSPGESRPGAVGATSGTPRRRQLGAHSAVGPHRVGDGSTQVACPTPVTGAGANPGLGGVGPGPQRDARGQASGGVARVAVARGAPVRRAAPRPGPVVTGTHQGSSMSSSLRQGFGSWRSLTRGGTASRRTAPACATGGTPPGRSSPPGWRGPSSSPSSSPSAASSP